MSLAPFFDRIYGAVGAHLAVSRESLSTALSETTIGIRCGELVTQNDEWIADLLVNLVARLYPNINITGTLESTARLGDIARAINPAIAIGDSETSTVNICLGGASSDRGVFPSACGWVARVDHSAGHTSGLENPYSAAAAAALACAEVFRRVFLGVDAEPDVSVSLLNFDDHTGGDLPLQVRDTGAVLVVGVGAVANAALWVVSRDSSVRGLFSLIDSEVLTLANLQRYVLGTMADVDAVKVRLGARELERTQLRVETESSTLEQFAETHDGVSAPTVMISVDNIDGRRAAQALLPRLVVNGWTGERAAGASWHVFSQNAACLACLYHPRGQGLSATEQAARAFGLSAERAATLWVTRQSLSDEDFSRAAQTLGVERSVLDPWHDKPLTDLYTDVACGAVPLDIGGLGRVEAVPLAHQSALAGILMAAELMKRTDARLMQFAQADVLVSWENLLEKPPLTWTQPRAREQGCICGDSDYQAIYGERWNGLSNSPV